MKTTTATTELERMSPSELGRELRLKRSEAAGQRLGLEMGKSKDSAKYKTLRREIARMTMVLGRMGKGTKSAESGAKNASKLEKNPVQDAGSKSKTAPAAALTKKRKAA